MSGQDLFLSLELQVFPRFSLFFMESRTAWLWLQLIYFIFYIQLLLSFTVFLLNILFSLLSAGILLCRSPKFFSDLGGDIHTELGGKGGGEGFNQMMVFFSFFIPFLSSLFSLSGVFASSVDWLFLGAFRF